MKIKNNKILSSIISSSYLILVGFTGCGTSPVNNKYSITENENNQNDQIENISKVEDKLNVAEYLKKLNSNNGNIKYVLSNVNEIKKSNGENNYIVLTIEKRNKNGDIIETINKKINTAWNFVPIAKFSNPENNIIHLNVGDKYIEKGVFAVDREDGELLSNVKMSGGPVNTDINSTYLLKYYFTDSDGNETVISRTVIVGTGGTGINENFSTDKIEGFYNQKNNGLNGEALSINPNSGFYQVLTEKCSISDSDFLAKWNKDTGVYNGNINCNDKSLTDEDLTYFNNLKIVNGDLGLYNNSLTNVNTLSNLEEVSGNFYLNYNPNLSDISGLSKLNRVGGNFYINNNNISDFKPLSNLHYIGNLFSIKENPNTSLEGLENISHNYKEILIDTNKYTTKLPINSIFCQTDWIYSYQGNMNEICEFNGKIPLNFSTGTNEISGDRTVLTHTVLTNDFIKVDPSKSYKISFDVMSGDEDGSNYSDGNINYIGFSSYDIDKHFISQEITTPYTDNVQTELVEDLNPGDTEMYIKDGSKWYDANNNTPVNYVSNFVWYPYMDSRGTVYPEYTYSRNWTGYSNFKDIEEISTNKWKVTFVNPWSKEKLNSGTKVMNTRGGGTFNYLKYGHFDNNWTHYEFIVSNEGLVQDQNFRYGTRYIKGLILPNYHSYQRTDSEGDLGGETFHIKNFTIEEIIN